YIRNCARVAYERAANTLHRARINTELLGNHAHAWPPTSRQSLPNALFQVRGYPRPAQSLSLTLGPRKSGTDSFLNDRPFDPAQHLKHRLACRCPGIKALLAQEEVDAERMKLGQKRD